MIQLSQFQILTFSKLLLVGDLGVQVPSVCIVHDDTETPLVHERLLIGDDIGVSHRFQDMDL